MKKIIAIALILIFTAAACSCSATGGEQYSYDSLYSSLSEAIDNGADTAEVSFRGSLDSERSTVEEDLHRIMNCYDIGSRISGMEISYREGLGSYTITMKFNPSDREKPEMTVRDYTKYLLEDVLYDAVMKREEHVSAVFTQADGVDSEKVNSDIISIQSENEYIAYLTSQFRSSIYTFSDAVEVYIDIDYREGTSSDIIEIGGMSDLEIINCLIDRFSSWDEKVVLHSGSGIDMDYITGLVTQAYANDCRDIVCEPTGVKAEKYSGEAGYITEVYLDMAASGEQCEEKAEKMRAEIDKAAAELRESTDGMTRREKLEAITEYVCGKTEYDQDIADTPVEDMSESMFFDRTVYGVLVSGRTVCTGYAYTVKVLCDELDIPCWVIFGKLYDGSDHAWNAVEIDGEVKYIDATFIDEGHDGYFLFDRAYYTKDNRANFEGWIIPFE